MGFSRQVCWRGLPFPAPGVFPTEGWTRVSPCIAGRCFTAWAMFWIHQSWQWLHDKNRVFTLISQMKSKANWDRAEGKQCVCGGAGPGPKSPGAGVRSHSYFNMASCRWYLWTTKRASRRMSFSKPNVSYFSINPVKHLSDCCWSRHLTTLYAILSFFPSVLIETDGLVLKYDISTWNGEWFFSLLHTVPLESDWEAVFSSF